MSRILKSHFDHVAQKLEAYSKHFDLATHGDIKGFGREALVNDFLKTHLPDQIEYLTGEIFDGDDNKSGQIDIIVQSKNYPKIPLLGNTHLVFADSVMAIIEVKSDLNKSHLYTAFDQIRKIKSLRLQSPINGDVYGVPNLESIPCMIFAFKGMDVSTYLKHINSYMDEHGINIGDSFVPELVVILSSRTFYYKNNGWLLNRQESEAPIRHSTENSNISCLYAIYQYLFNLSQSFMFFPREFSINQYVDNRRQDST